MKRFFILAVMVAAASSSFAYSYYGSYSSPKFEMPGWLTFMCVVMIAWGILEIILFFKIWGMTNDIKALKKDYFSETKFETKEETANHLRRNLVMGNTENVKRILLQNFINNVELDFKSMVSTGYIKDENGDWVFVYHSRDEKCFNGECGYSDQDPLYDPCRSARKRKVLWDEKGFPILNR